LPSQRTQWRSRRWRASAASVKTMGARNRTIFLGGTPSERPAAVCFGAPTDNRSKIRCAGAPKWPVRRYTDFCGIRGLTYKMAKTRAKRVGFYQFWWRDVAAAASDINNAMRESRALPYPPRYHVYAGQQGFWQLQRCHLWRHIVISVQQRAVVSLWRRVASPRVARLLYGARHAICRSRAYMVL